MVLGLIAIFIVWNIVAFFLKAREKRNEHRLPNATEEDAEVKAPA